MARRRMPRRRFRRYRRRRYGRRVYRRRAQAQQRTKSRFVVKTTTVSNIVIAPSAPGITADASYPNYAGTASLSVFNNLVKSSYFTSIAKMYDAVRLDWVKVKITPTTSVLLQDQKQAVFVSAWDRNGLTNPKEPPNFAEIASYSSAFQRAINLQATSWSATRKIFATSVAEKSFLSPLLFYPSPAIKCFLPVSISVLASLLSYLGTPNFFWAFFSPLLHTMERVLLIRCWTTPRHGISSASLSGVSPSKVYVTINPKGEQPFPLQFRRSIPLVRLLLVFATSNLMMTFC